MPSDTDRYTRTMKQNAQQNIQRGWNTNIQNPDFSTKQPVFVYLVNPFNDMVVSGMLGWEGVSALAEACKDEPITHLTGALFSITQNFDHAGAAKEQDAVYAAAAYATRTQCFKKLRPGETGVHFVVLQYPLDDTGSKFRPFALKHDTQGLLLTPEQLNQVTSMVIEQDRQSHPDWFDDDHGCESPSP